ncbi:MAG: acVLRF1 family peptidyl-tRNA hydrolase [Streptosporangiaceae bacterium]
MPASSGPASSATAPRRLDVGPERLVTWVESFGRRHGGLIRADRDPAAVTFFAADGARAVCQVPFPPLSDPAPPVGSPSADQSEASDPLALARLAVGHATADRTVGVLLVRLGGYAAGVFTGPAPVLAAAKVGSRLVHGRSAAGGQSQQRFARRREKQAREALGAAADTAATVFAPYRLDVLVLGGDRRAVAPLRGDARLAAYFDRAADAFLTVPDPRLAVLKDTPRLFRAIRILLTEAG